MAKQSRLENARSNRTAIRRMVLVAVLVLLVGAGAGVGTNFLLAEPRAETANTSRNGATTTTPGKKPDKKSPTKAGPQFDPAQAMAHVYALSEQVGSRPAGSGQELQAGNYVVARLSEYGYAVGEQPLTTTQGFSTRNIIGTKRGTGDDYTIIIAAHIDSPKGTKGAVNNASGVGTALELARVLSKAEIAPTLKFVFFGANNPGEKVMEQRLQGSRRFVEMLDPMDRREVVGVISVDSVGQCDTLALRTAGTGPQRLKDKMANYAKEQKMGVATIRSTTDSDNLPFEDVKIPAVWVEWCNPDGTLVTDDTFPSVQYPKVEVAGKYVEGFLLNLSSDDLEDLKY